MNNSEQISDLLALTTEIVAAHVSNNTVPVGDLPQLINQVYQFFGQYRERACGAGGAAAARGHRSRSRSSPTSSFVWRTARN